MDPQTERKLLLVQRSPTDSWANHWEFPGGGADPSDLTILHTAVREVREETGLEVARFKGLAGTFEIEENGVVKARAYVFLAKLGHPVSSTTASLRPVGVDNQEQGGSIGQQAGGRNEVKEDERVSVRVVLNSEEHQAYRWVGSREEVEGLDVPPNVRGVMMDLMDALNHETKKVKM